jgi:hypothetical protein
MAVRAGARKVAFSHRLVSVFRLKWGRARDGRPRSDPLVP